MQDSIYHMILKSHLLANSSSKHHGFAIRKRDVFMNVNAKRYNVICIFNQLVDYRF